MFEKKGDCCGCTACLNECPVQCIHMQEDKEGFLYPVVDKSRCMHCGMCMKVCPIKYKSQIDSRSFCRKAYVAQNIDVEVRYRSTSGGVFTAIAEYILDQKGIVFGAAFDSHFYVRHIPIIRKKDLDKICKSKYVQSDMGNVFREVKDALERDRWVGFSGTPCQIEGLVEFLKHDYPKLVLVDFMCRAVPSPGVWKKYLDMQYQRFKEPFSEVIFRDKFKYGYQYSTLSLLSSQKYLYSKGIAIDPYLRAFFSNMIDRPSCYSCPFRKKEHRSDFTIWDCFHAKKFSNIFDEDGTTRVLINSEKGQIIFNNINCKLKWISVDADKIGSQEDLVILENNKRNNFFRDFNLMEADDLFHKYFPLTTRNYLEHFIRIVSIKLGVAVPVKEIAKKLIKDIKR